MTIAKNATSTLTAIGENSGAVKLHGKFVFLLGGTFVGTYVLLKRYNDRNAIGVQDGGDGQALLTDSTMTLTADEWIGAWVGNDTDGSFAPITDNAATTVTGTLIGGTDTDWDDGDIASFWEVVGTYTTAQYLNFDEPEDNTDYIVLCTAYTSGTPRVRISQ